MGGGGGSSCTMLGLGESLCDVHFISLLKQRLSNASRV